MTAREVRSQLRKIGDAEKAKFLARFFKTGPGEYAHGDRFLGVTVPQTRKIARAFRELTFKELTTLLRSKYHEDRLAALLVLVDQYQRADRQRRRQDIYEFYTSHLSFVNNWDLVDLSAHKIVGPHLHTKSKAPLTRWARSDDLWERRVAILSTYHYIRLDEPQQTLRIAKILLKDEHDLIHKAVGWMLREVGKRDLAVEERFLKTHYKGMPRTMLRYAIEKFPERKRKAYLAGKI